MKVLSLFAGIGGFDLGFELAGWTTVATVEIDKYCNKILEAHFPHARQYTDICTVSGAEIARDCGPIDVICGGFPCQDISVAGKGAGLQGKRSGLWSEYKRLVSELRPRWVVIENVDALRARGLDRVIADMEEMAYQAWCFGIPASVCGATHQRKRIVIVAYNQSQRRGARRAKPKGQQGKLSTTGRGSSLAYADSDRREEAYIERDGDAKHTAVGNGGVDVANAHGELGRTRTLEAGSTVVASESLSAESGSNCEMADTNSDGVREQSGRSCRQEWPYSPFAFPAGPAESQYEWEHPRTIESQMGLTANGLPLRMALRACGNAFVPAIPFLVARAIERVEVILDT